MRKSVGRKRQIFVKIRCDRSQIVHPRTGAMLIASNLESRRGVGKSVQMFGQTRTRLGVASLVQVGRTIGTSQCATALFLKSFIFILFLNGMWWW